MLTRIGRNRILQSLLMSSTASGGAPFSNLYIGLCKDEPTIDTAGSAVTEPKETNPELANYGQFINDYARIQIKSNSTGADQKFEYVSIEQAPYVIARNNQILYFPEATGPWGSLSYFCIFDAATNGNLVAYAPILDDQGQPTTISPVINTIPIVRKNQLQISLD